MLNEDAIEIFPVVAFGNLKLVGRYLLKQFFIILEPQTSVLGSSETLVKAQDAFPEHLYSAYSSLSILPTLGKVNR